MRELLWTETARNDLRNIYAYIGVNSVHYADKFCDGLIEKVDNLTLFPNIGRMVPEIGDKNVREIFYHSYRIIYKIIDEFIYVLQISHMSMEFRLNEKNNDND